MQGVGISGLVLILVVIIVIVYIIKLVFRTAINKSEFKRSVDNDLKQIKKDIENINEALNSKGKK